MLDLYARLSPEGDRRLLQRPEFKAMFLDDLLNGSRTQLTAPMADVLLFTQHWGFDVADVKVPVRWWHGDADHIVPFAHGEHVVDAPPRRPADGAAGREPPRRPGRRPRRCCRRSSRREPSGSDRRTGRRRRRPASRSVAESSAGVGGLDVTSPARLGRLLEAPMKFEQYYLDCLSHASYLIGDEASGRAAVVDPRRDVSEYVADATAAGLEIVYVIETHFHADFLSGHLELAERTGAEIVFGAAADTEFPARHAADGERLFLGDVVLEVRATPGHTPESISIVVWEHAADSEPWGVLTGDTLFIGDVGRPDLLSSIGMTADELGAQLYDSLHNKLLTLPDATRVWPAHGAGSACGKNLSTATTSTMGEQRRENYALQPMDRARFVDLVTDGQPTAPDYFIHDTIQNRRSRALLDDATPSAITPDEVDAAHAGGAVLLDVRDAASFAAGHLAGSVNIGIDGRFAEYAGEVADPDDEIVLIAADPDHAAEAKVRLGRIGFDHVLGAITDVERVLTDEPERAQQSSRLTAAELAARRDDTPGLQVVDVRNPGEVALGQIEGSTAIPLAALRRRVDELDLGRPIVVHCAGGYRSSIAASWLRAAGAEDVSDLLGGYGAWAARTA